MRERSIDRIRNATFSHSVRGYDRHEVDRFLTELAEWLETGGEGAAGSEAVRAELEHVGEVTAQILTEAHDAGEEIRERAAAEVRQKLVDANVTAESLSAKASEAADEQRQEADAYANRLRAEADSRTDESRAETDAYAEQTRSDADAYAADARGEAEREAERIVADANRRKADVEAVISDLEERRDAVLAELDRLASGIAGTATQHRLPEPAEDTAEVDAEDDAGAEPAPARESRAGG